MIRSRTTILSLFFAGFFIFAPSASAQTATETVSLIRQDCTGYTSCYTSLSAWEAARQRDLVAANQIEVARIEGTWTNADTAPLSISGWATDATRYIRIYTAPEARHAGVWDAGRYRLETSSNAIEIYQDYSIIDGLQIRVIGSFSSNGVGLRAGGIHLRNNILRNSATGTTDHGILFINASSISSYVSNNILYDWTTGIRQSATNAVSPIYNNTIRNSVTGILGHFSRLLLLKNNLISGGTTPFSNVFHTSSNYNATDGATATGGANDRVSQTFSFADVAGSNFHLAGTDTGARDFGATLSSDSLLALSTDIDGTTRTAPYDIGADETSGGTPPPSDTTAPTTPTNLSATAISSSQVNLSWTASTDNTGVTGYRIYRNGTQITTTTTTSYSNTGLTAGTAYSYTVAAYDAAGNVSTQSASVSATTQAAAPTDTTAPTTPTNLSATAVSSSQINLSWTASTDAVGVTGYRVYRNGIQIITVTTNSYSNTGLSPSTSYTYTVAAYDAAGNVSAQTAGVSATTQAGTTPPTTTETAAYPLQILQPQPNLTTHSRYYKAYPGILYKVPVGVFGGVYPFTYSLPTAPSGMTIDASTGVVTWPNPTTSGSPHPVTVNVTDATGTTVTRSWAITVTTSGFIFVDGTNGTHALNYGCTANCGTGTITNPFRSMNDFYQASGPQIMTTANDSWRNSNFLGQFVYWRAGTYGLEGGFNSSGQQFNMIYRGNSKPHVWLAYPGENVVIDHSLIPGTNGAFLDARDGDSTDFFVQGITFRNMLNHVWRMGGYDNHVFFDNKFVNLGPGVGGDNSSFLMWARYAPLYADNTLIKNNTFDTMNIGSFIKTYSMRYGVFEGNTFAGGRGSGELEGIAIKNDSRFMDIRGNAFDGDFGDGAINGNWNDSGDLEIRFNRILNSPSKTYLDSVAGYSLQMNHDGLATAAYVHRNTMDGSVVAKYGVTGNGPFRVYDNVIVNENAGTPVGSHVSFFSVADPSVFVVSGNLAGYAADNVISTNGNLTAAYASFVGTKGAQLSSGVSAAPTIPASIVTVETTPPSTPTGLAATALNSSQVNLSWNPSTDNVGVVGYRIYRSGTLIASSVTNSYSNTGLSPSTAYSYTVAAYDAAGNTSAQSTGATATTSTSTDTTAPTISLSAPTAGSTVASSITVSATASDNIAVSGVQFLLDGVALGTEDTTAPYTITWNTTTATNASHTLSARARDAAGNQTTSATVTVTVSNTTTPPPSTLFSLNDRVQVTTGTLNVRSTPSTSGTLLGTQAVGALGTIIGGPTVANGFNWWNVNYDNAPDGWSVEDNLIAYTAPTTDITAPTISLSSPTAGSTVSGTTITLSASASDNIAVAGVQFLLDGVALQAEDTTAPYTITWNTTTATNTSHTLSARARDVAGNQTTAANITVTVSNVTTPPADTTAPTTPTNLTATAVSSSQINLSWTASTDAVGVTGYRVYRNGTELTTTTATTYLNTGLSPSTSYTYTVAAYDAAGNTSAQSIGASGSTQSAAIITPPPTTTTTPSSTTPNNPSASGATGSISITTPTVSTPTTATQTPRLSLTRNLYRGIKGTDVKNLQTFLIQQNYLAPTNDTGFYGALTKQAVEKYQCAKNLICSGTETSTGYGVVGPKTRTMLNSSSVSSGSTTFTTNLTPAQADAIIALVQSFGAEQAVVDQVKRSLGR